jgi:two-component system NarL family sensor kinase
VVVVTEGTRKRGREITGTSTLVSTRKALILGGLILLLWLAGVLWLIHQRATGTPPYIYWEEAVVRTLVFSAVGTLLATRRPANPIGWLFIAVGLLNALQLLFGEYAYTSLVLGPERLPYGATAAWLSFLLQSTAAFLLFFVLLLFPTGRLLSSRWRIVAWAGVCAASVGITSSALVPGPLEPSSPFDNPFGVDAANFGQISTATLWLFFVAVLGALLSLVVRFVRSRGEERQQIKWFVAVAVFGIFSLGGVTVASSLLPEGNSLGVLVAFLQDDLLWTIVPASLPIAVAIAILKYRLYDIDIIINRTLVYSALTVCIVGIYVFVVGYFGAVFESRGNLAVSIFAAGLVAIMFQPLRERLQRIVNRLTYGERDDPYGVLARLGRRLEATIAPEAVLPAIVEDIARALRLPQVTIWLADRDTLRLGAAHGGTPARLSVEDAGAVETLRHATDALHPKDLDSSGEYAAVIAGDGVSLIEPLTHQGELVGALCLAPRSPGEGFSPADRRLLRDLATQSGAAAHEVQLTVALRSSLEDLRRSRERLIEAQEEERRRIQRDLHDGLGPVLASMRLRLEACLDLAEGTAAPLSGDLERLYELVGEATGDIRRLVYELRPPVLDQLGLVPAIRQHCERFERETGIKTELDTAPELAVPAAAEVTVLRVVQEALVNVQKHAQASHVVVGLERQGEWLLVGVVDDGKGLLLSANGGASGGTGLLNMRERAELLGGTLNLDNQPGSGTNLLVRIPARD